MKSPTKPLTLDKISTKLYQQGKFHSKRRDIKAILKNDSKYSFKIGLSTTFNDGLKHTKILQTVIL